MTVLSRLAALVVAVGLVLGALAIRDRGAEGPGDDGQDGDLAEGVVVACPTDLGAVCAALERADVATERVETETTAIAAAAGPLDGAWLVPVSWADVVDDDRARAGLSPLVRGEVLASSPVVLVGYRDRLAALGAVCGTPPAELALACVAGVAGDRWESLNGEVSWGRVTIGLEGPDTTLGLQTTATLAAGVAGPDFGATELRDPTTTGTLRQLVDAVEGGTAVGGLVGGLRTRGPSFADVVVALEVDVVGVEEGVSGPLDVVVPDPTLAVELVVVGDDEEVVVAAARLLAAGPRDQLVEAGWRRDGPPAGTPLAVTPVLAERPDGSSLIALRLVWDELVG